MGHTTDIGLTEARALIARAIDMAEALDMRGAIAVLGATGALVSASRMDHGGAGSMARARSKAWFAATQQIPGAEHLRQMQMSASPIGSGFAACTPEGEFVGPGGMPIARDGVVIGGIAVSGAGIGPFVTYPGADPQQLIADGKPANGEDLIVRYALGIPCEVQHDDDLQRWVNAYGAFTGDSGLGLGMADPPRASRQSEREWALAFADRTLVEAAARGYRVAVAIVDEQGGPLQQDRMVGAATASVTMSEATATAAGMFQCPSEDVAVRFSGEGELAQLSAALPFRILTSPGALPIVEDGRVVGALGVGGPAPDVCAEIAAAVLGVA